MCRDKPAFLHIQAAPVPPATKCNDAHQPSCLELGGVGQEDNVVGGGHKLGGLVAKRAIAHPHPAKVLQLHAAVVQAGVLPGVHHLRVWGNNERALEASI